MAALELENAAVDADHLAVLGQRFLRGPDYGSAEHGDDFVVVVNDEVGLDLGEQMQALAVLEDRFAHDPGEQGPEVVLVGDLAAGAVAGPHVDVVAPFLQALKDLARVGANLQIPGNETAVDVEEDVEGAHKQ